MSGHPAPSDRPAGTGERAAVHDQPSGERSGERVGAVSRYGRAFRSGKGIGAMVLLSVLVAVALLAPVLAPGGYDQQSPRSLVGPSGTHVLGTDEFGRDLLVRTIYGLRTDLTLLLTAVPMSMLVGTFLGLSSYASYWLGEAAQRILDIILGFPGMVLGITVVMMIGTGWQALFVAIAVAGLPHFGRLARGGVLEQQQREYVVAARTLGVSRPRVMVRHILPNVLDPLVAQASVFMVAAIFIEAGLSIVGLGIDPPMPSLGALLNVGARYITTAPSYVVGPGVVLLLLALAFTLLADALNEAGSRR